MHYVIITQPFTVCLSSIPTFSFDHSFLEFLRDKTFWDFETKNFQKIREND